MAEDSYQARFPQQALLSTGFDIMMGNGNALVSDLSPSI